MILIKGSVPGSKNTVVLLTDAIKSKTPANAPFPAGLHVENNKNKKDVLASSVENHEDTSLDKNGAEVEN